MADDEAQNAPPVTAFLEPPEEEAYRVTEDDYIGGGGAEAPTIGVGEQSPPPPHHGIRLPRETFDSDADLNEVASGSTSRPRYEVSGSRPPDLPPEAHAVVADPPNDMPRMRLDGAALHISHSYGFYRGVYWCWRCSGVAKSRPNKFGKPCSALGKPWREDPNINQLKNRKLPNKMQKYGWPDPEGTRPHPKIRLQSESQC